MLPGAVSSLKRSPRRVGDVLLGSWARTFVVAAVLLIGFAFVGWLALTGQLSDPRYANIPVVHPYPPAGYYQNPFNPTDRGDLINAAEASRVKADLLRDGQIEVQASERGDASILAQGDTGNRLARLRELIASDAAQGMVVRTDSHLDSIVIGRLVDPNDPSISWCVEERGTATLTYLSKASGQIIRKESFRFAGKFWLVRSDDRYLITDAQITNQPVASS
jgi:hypothetical protein